MKYFLTTAPLLLAAAAWGQDLPGLAAGIVEQAQSARQAVAARDKTAALDRIRQAMVNADSIKKDSVPGMRPILVPIRTETDTTSTYTPVKRSKSGQMSANRLKKDTSIRDVEGEVTTVRLDVTAAADHLADAQDALSRGGWDDADGALAAVSNSVVHTTSRGNMPLLMARQNLLLARARVLEDKYKDAALPLRSAAEALANFEKESPGPNADKAEYIRQQIVEYARTITHDHPSDAVDRIDSWLDPVNQWWDRVAH